jgi:hypothetical protein
MSSDDDTFIIREKTPIKVGVIVSLRAMNARTIMEWQLVAHNPIAKARRALLVITLDSCEKAPRSKRI